MPRIDTIYELINFPYDNNKGEFLLCKIKNNHKLSSHIKYLEDNKNKIIDLNSNIFEEITTINCNTNLIKTCNLLEFITYINNKMYAYYENNEIVSKYINISSGDVILFKTNNKNIFVGITLIDNPSYFNNEQFNWMTSQNLLIKDAQFIINTFKK